MYGQLLDNIGLMNTLAARLLIWVWLIRPILNEVCVPEQRFILKIAFKCSLRFSNVPLT